MKRELNLPITVNLYNYSTKEKHNHSLSSDSMLADLSAITIKVGGK